MQVYMAEHIGMDRSFVSDLENGKKEVCIRNLKAFALQRPNHCNRKRSFIRRCRRGL